MRSSVKACGLRNVDISPDDQAVNWGVLTFKPETDFPDTMVKAVISTPDRGMIFVREAPLGLCRSGAN